MAIVLKIDTKASLYEPLEVEIDGCVLKTREITLGNLEDIQHLLPEITAGSATAAKKLLAILLEGDNNDLLRALPLAQIKNLIDMLIDRASNPTGEEKNAQRPEDGSLPS